MHDILCFKSTLNNSISNLNSGVHKRKFYNQLQNLGMQNAAFET